MLLVYVTSFFMFKNTRLHATSHHDVTLTLIAIQCDSLCANCGFLKTGLVDHIGVLQTLITHNYNTNKNYWSLFYLFIIKVQVILVYSTDQHHDRYPKCIGTLSID